MEGEPTDMATLSSIVQALESLAKLNRFHEKIMLGIVTVLGLAGVILLIFASLTEGTDRVVTLVGGGVFLVLTFLPYNQIQNLRKQNLVIGMTLAVTAHLQEEVTTETLNELMRELLQFSLRR